MKHEVELYFDSITDFDYDDYVTMCNKEGREVFDEKSKDFKNWNKDMKLLVFRMFLIRLANSEKSKNLVNIKTTKEERQENLHDFLTSMFEVPKRKFRFVREDNPDKLSLFCIDENKKKTTYKITFVDDNISYEHIF